MDVNPKHPNANKATASTRLSDGPLSDDVKLLLYNVKHNVNEQIIPIKRFDDTTPFSSDKSCLNQSLMDKKKFFILVNGYNLVDETKS
jgi:hypothetical protein